MESHVYDEIYRLEKSHWWFRGRRIIIYDLLKKFVNKKTTSALDVGCGTGYNYNILKGFSANITGVDNNDIAVSLAKKNFPNLDIIKGDIPFISMDKSYDLITLFDVMEHIPDDEKTMKFLDNILNPGGFLVMTVPAWPFLWSEHDQAVHHQRRYTKRSLIRLINNYPDLKIVKISYYNTILFPFIVLIRFFSLIKYIRKIYNQHTFDIHNHINLILVDIYHIITLIQLFFFLLL